MAIGFCPNCRHEPHPDTASSCPECGSEKKAITGTPVHFAFHDEKAHRMFYRWLNEAEGSICLDDLIGKYKKQFNFWPIRSDEEGLNKDEDGIVIGLEYQEVKLKR